MKESMVQKFIRSEFSFWLAIVIAIVSPVISVMMIYTQMEVRFAVIEQKIERQTEISNSRMTMFYEERDRLDKRVISLENCEKDYTKTIAMIKARLGL